MYWARTVGGSDDFLVAHSICDQKAICDKIGRWSARVNISSGGWKRGPSLLSWPNPLASCTIFLASMCPSTWCLFSPFETKLINNTLELPTVNWMFSKKKQIPNIISLNCPMCRVPHLEVVVLGVKRTNTDISVVSAYPKTTVLTLCASVFGQYQRSRLKAKLCWKKFLGERRVADDLCFCCLNKALMKVPHFVQIRWPKLQLN